MTEAGRMFFSVTARNSGIVFGGNLLNAILGFVSMIIVARTLGPLDFGLFSVATSTMAVTAGLADLGIGTGLVRFSSLALEKDEKQAMQVFKAALDLEVIISLVVLVGGWLLAPTISSLLGRGSELVLALRLAFIGAGALSMWSFVTAVFQSWQKFLGLAIVNVATNIFKLVLILALLQLVMLREIPAIAAYVGAPILGLVISFYLMPRSFMKEPRSPKTREAYSRLIGFSKWIMVSYIINSVIIRVDVFVLTNIKGLEAVGLYSAGFQLAQVFPLLIGSMVTVLLPQVSRMSQPEEFLGFAKKSLIMSMVLIIILLPVYLIASPVIGLLLPEYLVSITIFKILLTAFLLNIIFNPLSTILLAIDRPDLLAYTNGVQLIVAIAVNIVLIPVYGAYGAAYAFFIWTAAGAVMVASALVATRRTWS